MKIGAFLAFFAYYTKTGLFFAEIVGRALCREIPKDPAGAFEILEKTGTVPNECLYIGDSDTDMQTGKNALKNGEKSEE